jgi:hypothetical protein
MVLCLDLWIQSFQVNALSSATALKEPAVSLCYLREIRDKTSDSRGIQKARKKEKKARRGSLQMTLRSRCGELRSSN